MQAVMPYVEVSNDDPEVTLMARDGSCVGMSDKLAVWRFGYLPDSPKAIQSGCYIIGHGYFWVLATRKTGMVKEAFSGYALELPANFRKVIEWQPHRK